MERLDPNMLQVDLREGVTEEEPVYGRKYTLTHSDMTGELVLTIGQEFAREKLSDLRDEVLAEWRTFNGYTFLQVYVYVDGVFGPFGARMRNEIFREKMPLALEAIRYGDREFFQAHPELDQAPIWIEFQSSDDDYNRIENWGTPEDYK